MSDAKDDKANFYPFFLNAGEDLKVRKGSRVYEVSARDARLLVAIQRRLRALLRCVFIFSSCKSGTLGEARTNFAHDVLNLNELFLSHAGKLQRVHNPLPLHQRHLRVVTVDF